MPLDASIILSGAPQRTEPLNLLSNYAQLQQIQQNRIALSAHQQALQMGQLSQKAAELHLADQQLSSQQNQQMLGILRKNQGNVAASIQEGMEQGLPQAQDLLKHQGAAEELLAKTQKEQAEAAKATYEVKAKQRNSAINSLSTLRGLAPELQPLYYQHLRMQALQADPNLGNQLPPTWNPQAEQMVGALQESLLSQKEREDQALKQQEFGLKQQEFGLKEQTAQGQQQRWEAQTEQGKRQTELRAQEIGQQGAYQRGRLGLAQREFQQQFGDPMARLSAEQLAEAKKYASGDLQASSRRVESTERASHERGGDKDQSEPQRRHLYGETRLQRSEQTGRQEPRNNGADRGPYWKVREKLWRDEYARKCRVWHGHDPNRNPKSDSGGCARHRCRTRKTDLGRCRFAVSDAGLAARAEIFFRVGAAASRE
jgi:hypothetical protein